ncbi:MAG TPA: HAMP domain-containing sensor histidine kinase [Kofleriaceae bacterium]|jgi:signal transduction histidine kinase|nr:HAMP domain-containing sensor histidine kinase [Kofleriaceae bacterium]
MATERPITSGQWLARVGLVLALAASEVVVAALCGAGLVRALVLAVAALVFVIAYLVAPSPGKLEYDAASFRPILAMRGGSLLAAAVTGGLVSPLLPLVAAPIALSWTMARPRWRDIGLGALTVGVLLVLLFPARLVPPFSAREVAVLAGWSTILATWAIGRRATQLLEVQRAQAACLGRLREAALVDAESRRRGMELMTTKLAHELKNPLAAIKSLVQVETRSASDDRSRRRLEVVLGEVDRMNALLREYLDLARPMVDARVAPVQLRELMTDVSTLVTGRAEAAGVQLAVEGDGGALDADARLLKEAIVNVVCNAIEATPRGGSVTVTYHLDEAGASIVVRDTGRGMTKEAVTRVGTPFFTTREGGTGLGVVIAKTAIAQHGGTLEYQSTPGVGTVATIALPVAACGQKRASA